MSAMTRAELKLFLKQRGMGGMDPADIDVAKVEVAAP